MAIQADGSGGRTRAGYGTGSYLRRPNPAPSFMQKSAPRSAPAQTYSAPAPAPQPSYSGGGGGYESYSAPAPAPAPPPPPPRKSLADVIAADFGLRQQRDENARLEREYGGETERLRGETERDQVVRRADLAEDLSDMSLDSAEDLAGRGLLNSGGLFLNQDRINAEGVERENAIADLMTKLLAQRGAGLQGLQAQGRNALNERIQNITSDYARGIGGY